TGRAVRTEDGGASRPPCTIVRSPGRDPARRERGAPNAIRGEGGQEPGAEARSLRKPGRQVQGLTGARGCPCTPRVRPARPGLSGSLPQPLPPRGRLVGRE